MSHSELRTLNAGERLFSEGDASDSLIFIKEGAIEIFTESEGVKVKLGELKAGEVIGTVTLFTKEPRTASAVAVQPSTIQIIASDSASKSLATVPPWLQAAVKDTVNRLRYVNSQLVNAAKENKKILRYVITIHDRAAQLAALLSAIGKAGLIVNEDVEVYPLKNFVLMAESVLGEEADKLQKIYDCFVKAGLLVEHQTQKFGPVMQKDRISVLNDYAIFTRKLARAGDRDFIPAKLSIFLSALVRLYKAQPSKTAWEVQELTDALEKQTNKLPPDDFFDMLVSRGMMSKVPSDKITQVTYNAQVIQKINILEETWRQVEALSPALSKK